MGTENELQIGARDWGSFSTKDVHHTYIIVDGKMERVKFLNISEMLSNEIQRTFS